MKLSLSIISFVDGIFDVKCKIFFCLVLDPKDFLLSLKKFFTFIFEVHEIFLS